MHWHPTAALETLELRARVLAEVRAFFAARHVLEVETSALSLAGATDPALESLETRVRALGDVRIYLQTSPEFAMKRLLAAGSGDIYQICRVYRDGELGRWHEPEFTMLEWYRVGWDEVELMDEVVELIACVLALLDKKHPSVRMRYCAALERFAGVGANASATALEAALAAHTIPLPQDGDRAALLDLALSAIVVPALPRDTIVSIHDFPAEQAALARIKPSAGTAARFETLLNGIELANGFAELTDALEQRRRFEAELDARRRAGRTVPPLDEQLLAALAAGLPDCAGVAVGLDRLIAAVCGLSGIDAAIAFAHGRRES